jgi:hypothetical protein
MPLFLVEKRDAGSALHCRMFRTRLFVSEERVIQLDGSKLLEIGQCYVAL